MKFTTYYDHPKTAMQSITTRSMVVSWYFAEDFIDITATAPTCGWVAVGFNRYNDIVGTNLVMGAVLKHGNERHCKEDEVRIEDRFVECMGKHLPVEAFGGTSALMAADGIEEGKQTTIHFRLPIRAIDHYHLDLEPGTSLYLILAYSLDDDFAHHSHLRQHIIVTL